MSIHNRISLDSINNIDASLAKAIAIIRLLSNDGHNLDIGFQCNHSVVMDAIWDVSDQLDNIKNELRGK
ncbi:hypothetical protein RHO15_09780 [Utexia brackfieldae]|uniref:hypothetical protein n=1 Tax=Utexia brackfieldae TaxID=3074108 RepID=UPI00370D8A38